MKPDGQDYCLQDHQDETWEGEKLFKLETILSQQQVDINQQ